MSIFGQYESFLLKERRSSEHTVKAYLHDVEAFFTFSGLNHQNHNELEEVNYQMIRAWIVHLVSNEISNKSVNRKLSSLRAFFRWMKQVNSLVNNPMVKIKGLKSEKRIPEFVKQNEIDDRSRNTGLDNLSLKDMLIIEMFYQTGIRLSELINLKDIDAQNATIKVMGKRNKERVVPISNDLHNAIQEWIKDKKKLFNSCIYLFCTDKGVKLYPKYVYRLVNKYLSTRTNLKKKSPHVLRHTFATHMLNNGAGLEVIKELLGHANLSATQIYTHNSFKALTAVYKNSHPRGGE